jgi:phenylacetic acid degradation operon negative regulatory protein
MASTARRRSSAAQAPQVDALPGDGGLPRSQVGTSPQHLLMTLLADYWLDRTEPLPSAALVDLLAEFGASEPSTRAALNRLINQLLVDRVGTRAHR